MSSALTIVPATVQHAKDAGRRQTRLATGVLVHELAQPLSAMTANLDVLRASPAAHASPDVHAIVEDLAADAARAVDILRSMHALVRCQRARRVSIQLDDLVTNALRHGNGGGGATLGDAPVIHVHALPSVRVLGDPAQLTQALINVIRNACQAVAQSGTQGHVEISARTRGHDVWVDVQDNGPGFAPARLHAPRSPFVTTGRDGLGIGLVVARWVAVTHGGVLQIDNCAQGARVTIRLPTYTGRR